MSHIVIVKNQSITKENTSTTIALIRIFSQLIGRENVIIIKKFTDYLNLIENRGLNRHILCYILAGSTLRINECTDKDTTAKNLYPLIQNTEYGIPVLGLCYGHQFIAKINDGEVGEFQKKQKGEKNVKIFMNVIDKNMKRIFKNQGGATKYFNNKGENDLNIFSGIKYLINQKNETTLKVLHYDYVTEIPEGYVEIARNIDDNVNYGIMHKERFIIGLQFHPEISCEPINFEFYRGFLDILKKYHQLL